MRHGEKTSYLLVPGFHAPQLTQDFQRSFPQGRDFFVFPHLPPLATDSSLVILAFSAGVVVSLGVAAFWQSQGKRVRALIALDGWGVPLGGDFPIHRCSHDYFTHWSSGLLGTGEDNFYAEPAVPHLSMWGNPSQVSGWRVKCGSRYFMTLTNYLEGLLEDYD